MNRRILSVLLCVALLVCGLSTYSYAWNDVEIDLSDLFAPDEPKDPTGGDTTGGDTTGDTSKDDTTGSDKTDGETTKPSSKPSTPSTPSKPSTPSTPAAPEKPAATGNSMFTDVAENAWYYTYVTDLASKSIVAGYKNEDGTYSFKPQGSITRAEFVKLVVEAMGYESAAFDTYSDVKQENWYYSYVATAVKNRIIEVGTEDYGNVFSANTPITRAEAAKILVKATGTGTGIYATPYGDTDNEYVVALYSICLMQGSVDADGVRKFYPETGITRAETSTVIYRLLGYNADPEGFVKAQNEQFDIPALQIKGNVNYTKNTKDIGENPMSSFIYHTGEYPSVSHDDIEINMYSAFSKCFSLYPELFTFTSLNVKKTDHEGKIDVEFFLESESCEFSLEQLHSMHKEALVIADEISKELFGQEEYDTKSKVRKIYGYILENTEYPEKKSDIHYTSYGALTKGRALCQGYSSAFNLLCHASGIKSVGVSGNNHAWNAVLTEDGILYCDTATEDSSSLFSEKEKDGEYNLCLTTYDEMKKIHGKFDSPLEIYFDME